MNSFVPNDWKGIPEDFPYHDFYPWVKKLPKDKNIYCSFWCHWQSPDLIKGYDYYIVTYYTENINYEWLTNQKVDGKIIVIFPGRSYDCKISNVELIGYIGLHNDLNKIINWFGKKKINLNKQYKFSTICNRVTQGKIWTTTQILESESNSLVIHNPNWLEEKNVHHWIPTGNVYLDNLTNKYKEKYINLNLCDNFDKIKDNNQRINSNPWQPYYTDTALHIVGGSFHYSYMGDFTYPGPDIDEKTLKCLLAGVAFIPAMQFDVYNYLSKFGFIFDYNFDTSFDSDPGNLTRFEKICRLIDLLSNWSIEEIVNATKHSTSHNQEHILSGNFAKECNQYNQQQIEKIYSALQ